jgi:transcription elongation factor SPT5
MWIFDPMFANYQQRIKVLISGTRRTDYLSGDFEGKAGRIKAATRNSAEFDQSALIAFDTGEERSILVRYLVAAPPMYKDSEAIVLAHKDEKNKGKVVIVREVPDDIIPVSTTSDPGLVFEVKRDFLAALYPEY